MTFLDEIGTGFHVLPLEKRFAPREHAAAHARLRIDDGDAGAFFRQIARGRQARQSCADDYDRDSAESRH